MRPILTALLVLAVATAPGATQEKAPTISGTGTVTHIDLEGGAWLIVTDDDKRYDAHGLPEEFQHEGLRITFSGKLPKDATCIHMAGTILEVESVTKAEGTGKAPAKDSTKEK
jgi:hypothetical protein